MSLTSDPDQAIAVLDHATNLDRYNEQLHRQLIILTMRTGRPTVAARVLERLTANLREIDTIPHPSTIALVPTGSRLTYAGEGATERHPRRT